MGATSLKRVWIAELRRGWLSYRVIGTFETTAEAETALKNFKRENPGMDSGECFYEINWAWA